MKRSKEEATAGRRYNNWKSRLKRMFGGELPSDDLLRMLYLERKLHEYSKGRLNKHATIGDPSVKLLLSVKDVAFRLGISPSLVRMYVKAGLLSCVALPHPSGVGLINRILFTVKDVEAFIDRYRKQR